MQEKINVAIKGIQATMLIPLRGRAIMSGRFPDLYHNENDINIVNKLNFDFTLMDSALGEYGNLCYIARALAVEKAVSNFIETHPEAALVNIGAGLDTTFSKIDNGRITWYDLDLPDSMQFRNALVDRPERTHCIAKSVFDYSWFDDISYDPGKGLMLIAAGVFHFLPEDQIKELLIQVSTRFPGTELFFDINSTLGSEYSNQSMKASGQNATLIFSVDEESKLEEWSDQIKLLQRAPYFADIERYDELEEMTKKYMEMADTNGMCKFLHYRLGNETDLQPDQGNPVTLPEMMNAREQRQMLQQKMIADYQLPLISFTLNIAGPVKVFPLSVNAYEEGIRLIRRGCADWKLSIVHLEEVKEKTGYEALFSVDADPLKIKQMTISLETASNLGRLFDMDVIQLNGEKLSRWDSDAPGRRCLICDQEVFVCSRSRAHDVSELFQRTCEIIEEYFACRE
ncbi:MAG: citrate lyase holo-[acyl-carrier protein] synthase [Lachnospiraceae bacterium]